MTAHAKNPRTGRAYCTSYRSNQYRGCVEDLSRVDCRRCAKELGIVPAPKAESKFRVGTCQCCFNAQKVSKGGGSLMALHGYSRPGHGYIIGSCRGEAEQPFEVSCERTKFWKAELVLLLAHKEAELVLLQADAVPTLTAEIRTGKRVPNPKYPGYSMKTDEMVPVQVPVGQGETQNPYMPECTWEHVPSYATLKKNEVYSMGKTIAAIKSDIEFLTGKIDGWVKVWEK